MAVVGSRRRPPSLTLELPHSNPAAVRLHFHPAPAPAPPKSPPPPASSFCFSDLERLGSLGHGSGGTVYKVSHKPTSATYALKLPRSSADPVLRRQISKEISVLRRAGEHPHVVRLHAVLPPPNYPSPPALLLEYMDGGSLEVLLKRLRRPLPELAIREVARQALLGLTHLHTLHVAHRDIKPANLLVSSSGPTIKISDFGVSRVAARSLDPCDSYVGTCAYMSPERFDPDTHGAKYDGSAADIWSLGLTVMELYLNRFPLLPDGQRPDWATLMCAICFGDPPPLPESASLEIREFVECCLQKDPASRWTAKDLLRHPFVNGCHEESKAAFAELLAEAAALPLCSQDETAGGSVEGSTADES